MKTTLSTKPPVTLADRLILRNMNARHSGVTDWGLSHISIKKQFTILDVGCGGGRTVSKLAAVEMEGKIYGLDYSTASVAVVRQTENGSREVALKSARVLCPSYRLQRRLSIWLSR
jgi:2-polyprenyl-3-methyl-5-hydroxy-6-metoxy-1,4-benzoquinol methylase